jgi:hypothetical protein
MDIGAEFERLKPRREQRTLAWEARAKIMWGEEGRAVRDWLSALGIDSARAKKVVALALRERAGIIRAKGAWALVGGILLTLGGVGVGGVRPYLRAEDGAGLDVPPLWATTLLGFVFGLYPMCVGAARLILGARFKGSLHDEVEDSGIQCDGGITAIDARSTQCGAGG